LKEGEKGNQVFYSTGYTIASAYAGYMMALACLFCHSSDIWRKIAGIEYASVGCNLCKAIKDIKLESLEYWFTVFEEVFGLEKTVQNLWEESKKI
jgi:hypothetical protein